MRIGVVSDTHSKELPAQLIEDFQKVDFIIHAGDFCDRQTYEALAAVKRVEGVCGNMDNDAVISELPRRKIITCGRFRVGLFHGEGPPTKLLERVQAEFANEKVDAIVFGHSHHPCNQEINHILFFNPGSPNDRVFAPYRSYGILEITQDTIKGHIIKADD